MAWTAQSPSSNISSMDEDTPDPKDTDELRVVSFSTPPRYKSPLRDAIDVLRSLFPGVSKSLVMRKAFELGVPLLAANPDLLRRDTTPTPEALREAQARANASLEQRASEIIQGAGTVEEKFSRISAVVMEWQQSSLPGPIRERMAPRQEDPAPRLDDEPTIRPGRWGTKKKPPKKA